MDRHLRPVEARILLGFETRGCGPLARSFPRAKNLRPSGAARAWTFETATRFAVSVLQTEVWTQLTSYREPEGNREETE